MREFDNGQRRLYSFSWRWALHVYVAHGLEPTRGNVQQSLTIQSRPENAMPFVPALNVVECVPRFRNSITLVTAVNVLNFRKVSGAVTAADLEAVSLAYGTWFGSEGNDEVSNQISLFEIATRDLTSENSFVDVNVLTPLVGAQAAPVMPMSVTLAIRLTTGRAGRSFRGRTYFVGLPESAVAGDFVNSTIANGIIADYTALKSQMLTAGYEWVVVSRIEDGVPRVTAEVTLITGVSLFDLRIDSQRRRLAGEGT